MPEHPEIIAGWQRDAALYRAARRDRSEIGTAYGPDPRQTIDLFHPDNPAPAKPLVVFIHGGYWRTWEPALFSHFAAGANQRGYAVAFPGYRLCPTVSVSDIVGDLRAACLALHRRFKAPLVVCGHSAGGHLAAAMVATDWSKEDAGVDADLIRRGIAISGLYDLAPLLLTSINRDLHLSAEEARAMSPAFWPVSTDVHFTAIAGGAETPEYQRQSRLLAERWSDAGARVRHELIPGANHFTAPVSLTDPESGLVSRLVDLQEEAAAR